MTYTYDPSTNAGKVRRLIGDTVEAESEISDAEVTAWLADVADNAELAAIKILRSLAAKWAKRSTIASGNERMNLSDVSKQYEAMAEALELALGTRSVLRNTGFGRTDDFSTARRGPYAVNDRYYNRIDRDV